MGGIGAGHRRHVRHLRRGAPELGIVDGYTILKVVPVLAVIAWLCGALTVNIVGTRITRSGDETGLVSFVHDVAWTGATSTCRRR